MNLLLIPAYAKYMFNLSKEIKEKIGELVFFFLQQDSLYEKKSNLIAKMFNLVKNIYANERLHYIDLSKYYFSLFLF